MEALRKVTIPSKGKFNNGVKDFTLDMIGFDQEKKIFSSTTEEAIDQVLQDCIVEPKNFEIGSLTPEDRKYLLYQLRIHSYGDDYHVNYRGNEIEISLEDMEVIELPDDWEAPSGTLPMSKDTIVMKVITQGEINKAKKYAKEKSEKIGAPYKDLIYEALQALRIATINGEPKTVADKVNWMRSLRGRDLAYIDHLYNKISYGYTGKAKVEYEGETVEVSVPMTGEFFRPKFDD